jgi:hypothetical protein
MPKRTNKPASIEIVPLDRAHQAEDFKRMVERMVEQKVAEATQGRDALLQPWFQSHETSYAIKRAQTVNEQQKFVHYFQEWGCLVCGTTEASHCSNGMCQSCHRRITYRMQVILRKHAPASDQPQPTFMDTVKLARAALEPSIKKLAAPVVADQNSEESKYRTQAEAAREAGVSKSTLWQWITSGKVQRPAKRFSQRKWLWSEEDIAKLKALKAEQSGRGRR